MPTVADGNPSQLAAIFGKLFIFVITFIPVYNLKQFQYYNWLVTSMVTEENIIISFQAWNGFFPQKNEHRA